MVIHYEGRSPPRLFTTKILITVVMHNLLFSYNLEYRNRICISLAFKEYYLIVHGYEYSCRDASHFQHLHRDQCYNYIEVIEISVTCSRIAICLKATGAILAIVLPLFCYRYEIMFGFTTYSV